MSAIWGAIEYTKNRTTTVSNMNKIYNERCKIDKINEKKMDNQLFGCGIQFITKESENERLPIYSLNKKLFFTADCILDNRNELLQLLEIKDPKTPDGAIMYHAYLKWGYDCVAHFHGLYSIAIYDMSSHTLFLATDPTASRCLYYYKHPNGCTFSTLLEPILEVHPNIKLNEAYIQDYLIAPGLRPNLSATETPYDGISKIEAGTYVIITKEQICIQRYWSPTRLPQKIRTSNQCKELFIATFKSCVQNALRTNGEVGIALSSGFDSSSVAAVAADTLQNVSKNLHSYTYIPYYDHVSDKHASYFITNEKNTIEKTVAMYPNIKPSFLNTNGVDFYQSMDELLSIMEIPFKAFVNLASLQELFTTAAKDQCKVFLTGQYGNATISYGNIDDILYEMYRHRHYLSYLATLNQYCKNAKESRKKALLGCRRYFMHSTSILKSCNSKIHYQPDNPFLNKELVSTYSYNTRFAAEKLPIADHCALPKYLYEQYLYSTPALTYLGEYETKFGLANGILLRDPTRDPDIICFCHSIPYKFFAYHGIPRWLVRECLKEYLPREIIEPYLRYGLQNADWAYRVSLNWSNIADSLQKNLSEQILKKYVDQPSINTFFAKFKESFTASAYEDSFYLFILDTLSRFLT